MITYLLGVLAVWSIRMILISLSDLFSIDENSKDEFLVAILLCYVSSWAGFTLLVISLTIILIDFTINYIYKNLTKEKLKDYL